MHAPVPKAKAESIASRRREIIRLAKRRWNFVLNAKDQNFIRAPWATAADKLTRRDVEASAGIRLRWPNDAKPPTLDIASDGIPPWDKPRFDAGVFWNIHRNRPPFADLFLSKADDGSLLDQIKRLAKSSGATLPATWEGGNVANPDGKLRAKFRSSSYEKLLSESRRPLKLGWAKVKGAPRDHGRLAAAAVMGMKLLRPYRQGKRLIHSLEIRHAGHLLPHIARGWFGAPYPWRWDQPASRYVDVRIAGKATNSTDVTLTQAAGRDAEETIDCLGTHQNPPKQETFAHWRRVEFPRYDEHVREYYNRQRLHLVNGGLGRGFSQDLNADSAIERTELIETAGEWHPALAFFWLWLLAAVAPEEAPPKIHSSNIYWSHDQWAVKKKFGWAMVDRLASASA
jgi:hypothetical protein